MIEVRQPFRGGGGCNNPTFILTNLIKAFRKQVVQDTDYNRFFSPYSFIIMKLIEISKPSFSGSNDTITIWRYQLFLRPNQLLL